MQVFERKDYYVSFQYSLGHVTGFGAIQLHNILLRNPADVFTLSNIIAKKMNYPQNTIVILFFQGFSKEGPEGMN